MPYLSPTCKEYHHDKCSSVSCDCTCHDDRVGSYPGKGKQPMKPMRIKLTHERDTKRKTVYSDASGLLGNTVYVDTLLIQQHNGGVVPDVIYLDVVVAE